MNFNIEFDKAIYEQQNKLLFDSAWSKILKKSKQNFVTGIILVLLGIIIIIGKNNIGSIFIFFGILCLFFSYRLNDHYKKNKKKFFDSVNENIALQTNENKNSYWELEEDYFRFKDYKQDSTLKWISFSGYRKINNSILIDSKVGVCFVLSASEIGDEKFNEVIDFLNRKINKTSG